MIYLEYTGKRYNFYDDTSISPENILFYTNKYIETLPEYLNITWRDRKWPSSSPTSLNAATDVCSSASFTWFLPAMMSLYILHRLALCSFRCKAS